MIPEMTKKSAKNAADKPKIQAIGLLDLLGAFGAFPRTGGGTASLEVEKFKEGSILVSAFVSG
jgi:hypothetical protein